MTSIGYLIPEFPGQTHNFFWRERQALAELGIAAHLVSTRQPPKGVASPSWAKQAESETVYLYPVLIKDIWGILGALFKAGPFSWLRCVNVIFNARDLSIAQRTGLMAFIPLAAKLVSVARSQNWRHVHVHSCGNAANVALFASKLSNLTYSLTLHNPLAVYGGNQSYKWSHASFALVVSKAIYSELTEKLEGSLPQKLVVESMGVDVDRFSRSIPYAPYSGTGVIKLFACSRLNYAKGLYVLLESISILKNQGISIELVIAGEDDRGGDGYRLILQQQIDALGLRANVTLIGAVSEEQVVKQLENAHIFVLASLSKSMEGIPVVLMEAMAMSVPTISTFTGGIPELINSEEDGILVAPGDAEALAKAILHLSKNYEHAAKISSRSRMKIMESFNHRRSAQVIASSLTELNLT